MKQCHVPGCLCIKGYFERQSETCEGYVKSGRKNLHPKYKESEKGLEEYFCVARVLKIDRTKKCVLHISSLPLHLSVCITSP